MEPSNNEPEKRIRLRDNQIIVVAILLPVIARLLADLVMYLTR